MLALYYRQPLFNICGRFSTRKGKGKLFLYFDIDSNLGRVTFPEISLLTLIVVLGKSLQYQVEGILDIEFAISVPFHLCIYR
jgi:hypothetical protein